MTSENQRRVRVLQKLQSIAKPVIDDLEDVCWVEARNADVDDEGNNYCEEHCQAVVDKLNEVNPEHEYYVCRTFDHEGDSQAICETCGKYLQTSLTRHAVEQELQHWESHELTLTGKHASHCAYMLYLIIDSGADSYYSSDTATKDDLRQRLNVLLVRADAALMNDAIEHASLDTSGRPEVRSASTRRSGL